MAMTGAERQALWKKRLVERAEKAEARVVELEAQLAAEKAKALKAAYAALVAADKRKAKK